jgi:membrane associated rhomboid family serine protease
MTPNRPTNYPVSTMPRFGATPFSFPEFRGATRRLVLMNLFAFFGLLLVQLAFHDDSAKAIGALGFTPSDFLHGYLWQPLTYSFVHTGIFGTLLELISLWFMAGILESMHGQNWVTGLYASSVLGTALAATAIYLAHTTLGYALPEIPLYGCFGGIFGLLVALGTLHGDIEFLLFPLPISIKVRYLAVIYALISLASLFGAMRMYAFAELGGALAGLLFIRLSPRRGISFTMSETWYGMRNRYYRWKRRRAARKFEVYMRSQGRNVKFDGNGRQIDEDPNDKKRWN